jgi:hypothetical protein
MMCVFTELDGTPFMERLRGKYMTNPDHCNSHNKVYRIVTMILWREMVVYGSGQKS